MLKHVTLGQEAKRAVKLDDDDVMVRGVYLSWTFFKIKIKR